jgi:tRNA pseudouridine38-40 synthase
MPRFKLHIEYEGTRYSGWQIQKNARTVQGEIHEAIHHVFKTREFEFYGSGRTDAGVHALMQVAHLDVKTVLAPEVIRMKLNDELPADINILEVEKAPASFHARHNAASRSYLYQISRRRTAFGKRYVWWVKDELDFKKMQECSKLFVGMNNFASFTEDDPEEKSTNVLVESVQVKEDGDLILIRIRGSHFIWKMVRRIVGVLTEVGRGKLSFDDVRRFLTTTSDIPATLTAPPSGLFLEQVLYNNEQPLDQLQPTLRIAHVGHARLNKQR